MTDIFVPADILLPESAPLERWSVIACDQFSSDRSYWERVRNTAGDFPSTLSMIIPEAFLGDVNEDSRAGEIGAVMNEYINSGVFRTIPNSFIYVERTLRDGRVRRGLVGAIDLDAYDFSDGARAAILASEKTVLDRLPARIKVRNAAPLELPHAIAFISDPDMTVIEPISVISGGLETMYDFELMEGGGHIKGMRVTGGDADSALSAMRKLFTGYADMIVGDGNHSLAAAKVYWDSIKDGLGVKERARHPAKYALVELNNVFDPAVSFEAIHRAVFGTDAKALANALSRAAPPGGDYTIKWLTEDVEGEIGIEAKCVGDVIALTQTFLDGFADSDECRLDYIHGEDDLRRLAGEKGNLGLILPAMQKSDFFDTVRARGVFPKKSFSVGEAWDKRYYLECRSIRG